MRSDGQRSRHAGWRTGPPPHTRGVPEREPDADRGIAPAVTNATSDSLKRIAKLESRLAYGLRNPRASARPCRHHPGHTVMITHGNPASFEGLLPASRQDTSIRVENARSPQGTEGLDGREVAFHVQKRDVLAGKAVA
jgi:hypothetical protein